MRLSSTCNYADDNTLKATANDVNEVKKIVINGSVKAITWFETNLMEANPDKFQFMLLGKSVIPEKKSLKFSNVEIQCETSVKLLGVTLYYKLNFNERINFLAAKAGGQLSSLSKVRRFLDIDSKLNANKLENIQKRALKLALDHSNEDYGQLLAKANLTTGTLEIKRQKCILIEVYKSINNLIPVYLNDLFTRVYSVHFTRGSVMGLLVPSAMTVSYGCHSIKHFRTILWNSLPTGVLIFRQLKILILLETNY